MEDFVKNDKRRSAEYNDVRKTEHLSCYYGKENRIKKKIPTALKMDKCRVLQRPNAELAGVEFREL